MQTFSTRNIEQLISYPFKDPRWVTKLLFLALAIFASFIPILPWIVLAGYFARVVRAAAGNPGLPDRLPEWDEFGDLLQDGLRQFAVMFIYFLPATVIFIIAYTVLMINSFRGLSLGHYYQYQFPFSNMTLPILLGFFFLYGLSMVITLVTTFFSPAVITHTAVKRSFSAAFQFKEWWRIFRANWKAFLVALVLILGITYALVFVTSILFMTIVLLCLAPFVIAAIYAYVIVITGVLFGAAYREALQNLHPAVLPTPPPVEPDSRTEVPGNAEI